MLVMNQNETGFYGVTDKSSVTFVKEPYEEKFIIYLRSEWEYQNDPHSPCVPIAEYSTEYLAKKAVSMIFDAYGAYYFAGGGPREDNPEINDEPFGFVPPKTFRMPTEADLIRTLNPDMPM